MQARELRDGAKDYAKLGYRVFPCEGKKPALYKGLHAATTRKSTLKLWWRTPKHSHVALVTDGMLVIDIDGSDVDWPKTAEQKAQLASTVVSRTPRGGTHHIFRKPEGKNWKNSVRKLHHNVDTRSDGGYIIVPPSPGYEWVNELDIPLDQIPCPPDWLCDELDEIFRPKSIPVEVIQEGSTILEGARNDTLTRLAGYMRHAGFGETEIFGALSATNNQRCNPPMDLKEVAAISKSVCRYEPDQVATAMVQGLPEYPVTIVPKKFSSGDQPKPFPAEKMRIPGLISRVMDWCMETAPYPNQTLAFGGALSLMSFLTGRRIRDEMNCRTNMYILGLAHSGAGKDHPRKINTEILIKLNCTLNLGTKFASSEGLEDSLLATPRMLFQTDEIDTLIQSIRYEKEPRWQRIMGDLLTLYGASGSAHPMRRKAGKETVAGLINQPHLVLFGTAIPNHYYEALTEKMLTNGFFSRMMVLEHATRGAGQTVKMTAIPEKILEEASFWTQREQSWNLEEENPTPLIVPYTKDALMKIEEVRDTCDKEYTKAVEAENAVAATVWSRVTEQIRKVVLMWAASENAHNPIVKASAVDQVSEMAFSQTYRTLYQSNLYVSENAFEKDCLRVIRKLRTVPEGVEHSDLLRKMKVDAKTFNGMMSTLAQRGDIVILKKAESNGRKGTGLIYRIAGE